MLELRNLSTIYNLEMRLAECSAMFVAHEFHISHTFNYLLSASDSYRFIKLINNFHKNSDYLKFLEILPGCYFKENFENYVFLIENLKKHIIL